MPTPTQLAPPWRKGESDNARGKHPSYRQVLALCRKGSVDAVRPLSELMNSPETPAAAQGYAVPRATGHTGGARESQIASRVGTRSHREAVTRRFTDRVV